MKVYKTNRAKEPARQKEYLFCGYLHAPKRSRCPAYDKLCNACKENDHFESKCPNKDRRTPKPRSNISKRSKCNAPRPRVHHLDTSSEDDEDEYAHWVNAVKSRNKQRKDTKCLMLLDKQEIIFQINTGATIKALPAKFANEIKPYTGVLTMWNKSLMKLLGIFRKNVKNPKMRKTYSVEFVVFKDEDDCQPLLDLRTSTQMGLVEIKQ